MKKQILSFVMLAVMLVSAVCIAVPEPVSAASKPYMMVLGDSEIREKAGSYYIWVETKEPETNTWGSGVTVSKLKYSKSFKGAGKTLKTVKGKAKGINPFVITNGRTIYYTVHNDQTGKSVIYRTTIKGKKHKKVANTVKRCYRLAACYGNKLYYIATDIDPYGRLGTFYLYSYDMTRKKTKKEKTNYEAGSSYGRYMIGTVPHVDMGNYMQSLYDIKTKKTRKLETAVEAVLTKNAVYYATVKFHYNENTGLMTWKLKKYDLVSKKKKTLKTITTDQMVYMRKKAAYFKDYETGTVTKFTYATKKMSVVK